MDERESDQASGSSTGLLIGMMVGGGVVLLLVLLGVFGAGFYFMARNEAQVAQRQAAIAELVAPPAEEGPAPPAPPLAPAGAGRGRLIGVWEGKAPGGEAVTLEFLVDGTLQLATRPDKGDALTTRGRWEIVEEAGDRLKVRRTQADNTDAVQDLRFDGPDRLVIEGPGGAAYTRRAK
ncbi:MAG: hypothetical protein L0Y71_05835 [Gemmataceae bacterium]|nr:hypothetical protein [Gemmataceae bacterium]